MSRRTGGLYLTFIILFLGAKSYGQESSLYGKNAISINLTRCAISEFNLGYEHFFSSRRSLEINGGIIYINDFIKDRAKDITNSSVFDEEGFAGRIHYRIFRRPAENSRWRDYIATGLAFKHLSYTDLPLVTGEKADDNNHYFVEHLKQDRERNKLGLEFLWGKVYEFNSWFAFDFYYGAGVEVTSAKRTDHSREAIYVKPEDQMLNTTIADYVDESIYLRPVVQLGFKIRFRF